MSPDTRTPEEINAARQRRRHWYGYLADDNVEHIGDRIRAMLTGQRYTFVANNVEQKSSHPEVRTGQRLHPEGNGYKASPRVTRIGSTDTYDSKPSTFVHIGCCDTYGSWGLHTTFATEREARDIAYAQEPGQPPSLNLVYISIDGGVGEDDEPHWPGKIEIQQLNGYREVLHWSIAVEHPDDDEAGS